MTVSWVAIALVEATPISGPAWVGKTTSEARAIELSGMLTIEAMRWPSARACWSAASVSMVSPDCDTKSAAPPGDRTGRR